jgi:hypothetical protein
VPVRRSSVRPRRPVGLWSCSDRRAGVQIECRATLAARLLIAVGAGGGRGTRGVGLAVLDVGQLAIHFEPSVCAVEQNQVITESG